MVITRQLLVKFGYLWSRSGHHEAMVRFDRVLIPEMNLGQLSLLVRARYLKDVTSYSKVQGKPFYRSEILAKIHELLG